MGLFRFLNQWREKKDGTLEGPALSTDRTAIGDGVGVDPSMSNAEIRDAIDSAGNNGTVFFSPGQYTLSDAETVATDIDVFYPSPDNQTVKSLGNVRFALEDGFSTPSEWLSVFAGDDPDNGNEGIEWIGPFWINGNKSNVSPSGKQWDLLNPKNVTDAHFEKITVVDAPQGAFDFDECVRPAAVNCLVLRCAERRTMHLLVVRTLRLNGAYPLIARLVSITSAALFGRNIMTVGHCPILLLTASKRPATPYTPPK